MDHTPKLYRGDRLIALALHKDDTFAVHQIRMLKDDGILQSFLLLPLVERFVGNRFYDF
ncbi:hypothetical protein D3C73_1293200 [compost metagenome]